MSPVNAPLPVTTETFQAEVLEATVPVVVDFWAPWCGPCRSIAPVLDRLAAEYAGRVKVVKINVDEDSELAQEFQVQGIPTLLAFNNGEVAHTEVGFRGASALEGLFAHLAAHALAS